MSIELEYFLCKNRKDSKCCRREHRCNNEPVI
ncbi:hypothetical protein SS1G_00674 [Sclerotinia sclerotiorum 1980 UF-70]|uniref:Uncharacterized protein n=1 Tax=Sclerotinia sclerotiorum (strain ATCC 18683 / 1980 / Ss-1) TaxID=665079 RepID=A7E5U9_SCLS1|nr:hypothetical protein SS1G_00674 [Sclerotinia sclerotiorum 1980 UF-70]EDN91271.1 hypothetical protein SS1G_00674 [Sclerotinia sclerotiorum 1980 UF-70]